MLLIARAVGWRILVAIPVILVVTLGVAALTDLMPGSPGLAILGENATPERVAEINARYGYDRPVFERYVEWLGGVFRGDFGTTLFGNVPISDVLFKRLGVTLQLAAFGIVGALVIAVPFALIASSRPGGIVDRVMDSVTSAIIAIPTFVMVVLMSLVFVVWLGAFPATGWVPFTEDPLMNLRFVALPALTLALNECAYFYRVLLADMQSTLREDFVLVARTKGLPRKYILWRHALRPSLSSLVTVLGLTVGRLLGGAAIVEFFFGVPGLGAEAINAVSIKDMAMVQAIVLLCVVVYVLVFILVDLAYAWIDPRVSVR